MYMAIHQDGNATGATDHPTRLVHAHERSLDVDMVDQVKTSTKSEGAYELKFLLDDLKADELLKRARLNLAADPHADRMLGDRYQITSLYFDTEDLAVHRGVGSYGRRKFRLRRYGAESKVFLERKAKSGGLVRKRRTSVPANEVATLEHPNPDSTWPGHWFHRRLTTLGLRPMCQVTYDRVARVGMASTGLIRFTVDRQIRCRPAAGLACTPFIDGLDLLTGQSIVEFKFHVAMPTLFKTWIHELQLTPTPASKYRRSITACGLQSAISPDAAGVQHGNTEPTTASA